MEQETDAHIKNEVTKAHLIQATVQHFQPICTAQSGGSVIAPSFIGSKVEGNINIIISNDQGCTVSTDELNNNNTNGSDALQPQHTKIAECQKKLKATLKGTFSHCLEGIPPNANKNALNKFYTQLYITEGGSGQVNNEHEVIRIETTSKVRMSKEKSIHFNDLFVSLPGRESHVRTVITRGVASIGKTVSVNKFTLDWAEDRENTNLDFVFPLSFRELNMMRKKTLSLVELISNFFGDIKDTAIFFNDENKMLFILDGLDESRLSLDFNESETMSDLTQPNTIAVLLVNLIRGRLLPLALVWITSRPVASSQIPLEYVDLVTEVRGFNNPQKDDYFRRKIADESLANKVITKVKSCRTLYIMCHIPVFCWMVGKLANEDSKDMPKSLTQMYIHFLSFFVEDIKRRQPGRQESNADSVRTDLLSLGKLAFKELEKGHQPFYESDLIMNGISVTQASGVYTQIFNEVLIPCQEKMFCFVHLSIKEFFAALYVFLTFHNDNDNVLVKKSSATRRFLFRESSELILYKEAVEKALRCKEGHFDIFLRFLLGLSLECNQALLKHLMTNNRTHARTRPEIIKHIKERIRAAMSTDTCLNLFHCLNELNDHSLVEEIQSYLSSGSLNKANLSRSQWHTLVFVLLTSEEELSVFELSNYVKSEEGLLRLLPVMKMARVANLNGCNLTVTCCQMLANGISSSQLRVLDLSDNNLTDAGLMQLSVGLKNSKLETLRLRSCNLTEHSSGSLESIISSASCSLKILDLHDNDFRDEGVKKISGGLGSPHCKLEVLDLSLCRVTEEGCTFLASTLNSSRLRELDLSYNHPGSSGQKLLTALLEDPKCSLEKLRMEQCGESRIQPGP